MAFATVNDLTIHYKLDGSPGNAVLVFINSLGSDCRIWDEVVPFFAQDYFVIRYDKRGHGLSDSPAGPSTIGDHAADLADLLAHLGVETAVPIGISVGGMIALEFAARHPERVPKLVLSDTGAVIGTAVYWAERIAALEANGFTELGATIAARWFTSAYAAQHPAAYRGYANMLTRTPLAGYIATCAALRDADLRTTARLIKAPALVLCGAEDMATPPALGRELTEMLVNGRFQTIPDAAHLPCIEQPKLMAKAIKAFLEDKPGFSEKPDLYEEGMKIRRAVLSEQYVNRAEAHKTEFDADFQRFITETAWGTVWARPGLDRKTRHLITLAVLAAMGKENELALHIRATRQTGVTADEMKELCMQVAIYAGVPAANTAVAIAKKVYAEMES